MQNLQDSIDKRFDKFKENNIKRTGSIGTKDPGNMQGSL